jgi:hypothetical protein
MDTSSPGCSRSFQNLHCGLSPKTSVPERNMEGCCGSATALLWMRESQLTTGRSAGFGREFDPVFLRAIESPGMAKVHFSRSTKLGDRRKVW